MSLKKLVLLSLTALFITNVQASLVTIETKNIRLAQVFSGQNREAAINKSISNCQQAGGVVLSTKVYEQGELSLLPNYWQAVSLCLMNPASETAPAPISTPAQDPNAQFCSLRSTPNKCGEIGSCEWVAPKTSFCGVRAGFEMNPNAQFCYNRSTPEKCGEIAVCEFHASGRNGHCQARQ